MERVFDIREEVSKTSCLSNGFHRFLGETLIMTSHNYSVRGKKILFGRYQRYADNIPCFSLINVEIKLHTY